MYDLIVIGSGPGGYVAAIRASQLGLRTALVEKHAHLGGTCLNVGCIPSKALLHSTHLYHTVKHQGRSLGIQGDIGFDFDQMMKNKEDVVSSFNRGIAFLMKKNKIDVIQGHAAFKNATCIEVAGEEYEASHFVIATGSKPTQLPFLPFDHTHILSSTDMLTLQRVPKKLLVVGAGVIGVELGCVYQRLGADVEFVEFLDHICPALDRELSTAFQNELEQQGLHFHLSTQVESATVASSVILHTSKGDFEAEQVLVAVGRTPNTEGLGLEVLGSVVDDRGFIKVNGAFQLEAHPHIVAIGDVIGGSLLAHKASEEGVAAVEVLAGHSTKIEYAAIPSVVYTAPEVATVGFTEEQLNEMGVEYTKTSFPFKANSRARAMGVECGFIKMLTGKEGHLLGAHILGESAGELIQECVLAMDQKLKTANIAHASHAHPTLSEAIKEAALERPFHL